MNIQGLVNRVNNLDGDFKKLVGKSVNQFSTSGDIDRAIGQKIGRVLDYEEKADEYEDHLGLNERTDIELTRMGREVESIRGKIGK
jgi:hypothetical protein